MRYKGIDEIKLKSHGLSSVRDKSDKANINEAHTAIKGAGVLIELVRYFGFNMKPNHYSIVDILYNIPCVHRAFCITFSKAEMFLPISKPMFVKKDNSRESWIKFEINGRYANANILKSLPKQFEHDKGIKEKYVIRMKKRFIWDIHKPIDKRKTELNKYHEKTRHYLLYIYGESKLWYVKRKVSKNEELELAPSSILIFIVFHWLSELVRYNPKLFSKYMKSKQNWLLHEFIDNALDQFIDEIGCEITGQDIMCTGYRK